MTQEETWYSASWPCPLLRRLRKCSREVLARLVRMDIWKMVIRRQLLEVILSVVVLILDLNISTKNIALKVIPSAEIANTNMYIAYVTEYIACLTAILHK